MAEPTEEQKAEFLELISAGESFRIAAEQVGCTNKDFYRLAVKDKDFDALLSRAREAQQEALVDEMIELADSADSENYNAIKVAIWARQWNAAKRAPRKYGDKIQAEVSGKDGGPMVFKWET